MVAEGFILWETYILEIAILAVLFFFGDYIYEGIIKKMKEDYPEPITGFIFTLFIIVILSVVPLLVTQLILPGHPKFGIFLIIICLILCGLKYYLDE